MPFSETLSKDDKRKRVEDSDNKEKDYYKRIKRYEDIKEKTPDQ